MHDQTIELAVIGLGPRGLSVLERLCANAPDCVPPGHQLVVHVVDRHVLGGGRVWRGDQHTELLMNTVASQVSMFVDDSVECVGPILPGPSLYDWARSVALVGLPAGTSERVRAEARTLGPDSYPTRAFYGHYLRWTLQHLVLGSPGNVTIRLYSSLAVDLRDEPDDRQVVVLDDGRAITGLDAVVLTQGHLATSPTSEEAEFARFATEHGLRYIAPGNPADLDLALDPVAPGETVVLRGLGLNFFDHLALLTVGRGGTFHRDAQGALVYRPSGLEPRLVAGSRRGVPYQARGENEKGPSGRHVPLFLSPDVIRRLRRAADGGEPADFRRDVWPLIDLEVRAVYYAALIRARHCTCDADAFTRSFTSIVQGRSDVGSADPFVALPSLAEEQLLTDFGITPKQRWDWADVATPYHDEQFASTSQFRAWLRSHVDGDVREARLGNVRGALKAALDVLRDLRNEIRLIVDHGGLSGDSYREDLQGWYMPLNAYASIGPPVQRVEQLGALLDSGVLEILGPRLTVRRAPDGRGFLATSSMIPDVTVRAATLIEARLPEPDLRRTTDVLVRNLIARGECRPHRIPISGGGFYTTGGLAVGPRPYHLIDAAGHPHPRRFAFGVPTETVHWITAAGIRPGVNSVILADADAVARASVLGVVHGNLMATP